MVSGSRKKAKYEIWKRNKKGVKQEEKANRRKEEAGQRV